MIYIQCEHILWEFDLSCNISHCGSSIYRVQSSLPRSPSILQCIHTPIRAAVASSKIIALSGNALASMEINIQIMESARNTQRDEMPSLAAWHACGLSLPANVAKMRKVHNATYFICFLRLLFCLQASNKWVIRVNIPQVNNIYECFF